MTSACAIGVAIASTLLLALLSAAPRVDQIAAVFPPWWSPARAAAAAAGAGSVAGMGAWRSVVIVRGDAAGLALRLRRSGALLTLDARSFAICGLPQAGRLP
ncbi:hypothetical protein D3273_16915 [Lichenibacterium minor]|uniref:Uncharacterized protein n=1 Tax=Lichenibacterium minor TaxID=2316528 RepID=A0A4Q2U7H8_9HYPH|nr:hypothetical protein [Lichenibacterium minor]RYC30866.1 hypothetical protein D3273_16915 [Lichenibacterium minor]